MVEIEWRGEKTYFNGNAVLRITQKKDEVIIELTHGVKITVIGIPIETIAATVQKEMDKE